MAISPLTFDLPIGTVLMSNDGFTPKLGQICDIETSQWGQHYVVVLANGSFCTVHNVNESTDGRIGWSVATAEWIARLSA
jgi:hypothetical protein